MFSRTCLSRGLSTAPRCQPIFRASPSPPRLALLRRPATTTSTSSSTEQPIQEYPPPHSNAKASTSASHPPPTATAAAAAAPGTPTTLSRGPYPPTPHPTLAPAPPPPPTEPIPHSILSLLPSLSTQTPHYATLHLHSRGYLVTAGDTVRLPFRMARVQPGDVLRLTSASSIGSRDYTLTGAPYVDPRLFECRAVVKGVESEPMRVMEKTKRRNRRVKKVKSKHRFTELVVSELRVKRVEDLEREAMARPAEEEEEQGLVARGLEEAVMG